MNIVDLYNEKKYDIILEKHLQNALNIPFTRTSRKFAEQFANLKYTLFSSYFLGCYLDWLKLYKKAIAIVPLRESYWDPKERAFLAEASLEALCFLFFNKNERAGVEIDIAEKIEKTIEHIPALFSAANIPIDQSILSHQTLFEEYKKGNYPYYIVKFLYPYDPPFEKFTFNLQSCSPYILLTVDRVPREVDCYTSFEFKVFGYTKADTSWQGPIWEHRERFPEVKKALPLLNLMLLLAADATPGRFISPYCIEQVSSVELSQYAGNDSIINFCMGTDFTAQMVGGNVPTHTFTSDELMHLNKLIINNYGCKHFVMQYHQARNNISAGLYVESFLLFCSCIESMLYYWCENIATLCGKQNEYLLFSNSKISKCDSCDLYKKSGIEQKVDSGMEPSVFAHIEFLKSECGIKKKQSQELKKLVSKARNDKLRNDVVHGRINEVSLSNLKETEQAILAIQNLFISIQRDKVE
ncbi:hypothetical protein DSECCO2_209260 [anaerobic digester metagenome]